MSGEVGASPLLVKGLPLLMLAAVFCRGGAGKLPALLMADISEMVFADSIDWI